MLDILYLMNAKSILILGSGIGGLSAAGQLAHQGFDVTILEKRSQIGGKIMQMKRNGFTFDGGPSFITLTEVYDDWFSSIGRDRNDYIPFKKMDKTTTFYFANGKKLTLATNPEFVRSQIKKYFPGDEKGFDQFMNMSQQIYDLLYHGPRFARRNYHKMFGFDFLFDTNIISYFLRLHPWETWKNIVDRLFTHPELRSVFSYQATFLGMKPSEAMGTYSFFPYAEIYDGMYTVDGGIYGIVNGFKQVCEEEGVNFITNSEVTSLGYSGNRLTHVTSVDGTKYNADIFVSNIDGAYFYSNLMPAEKNTTFTEEKIKTMKHTNSYFTISLGLKQPIDKLTHHTFFVAEDWEDYFEKILIPNQVNNLTFKNTCYYVLQPSKLDPSLAPAGKATLFILLPVCGYDPEVDWERYEEPFKNFIYDMMEQRDNIPIRELIEEEIVYSPAKWGNEFNLWQNVILSFSLNFMQSNGFRMPNKSGEFSNLYFVGSSTIPGPGVPPCITSGELVKERIMECELSA